MRCAPWGLALLALAALAGAPGASAQTTGDATAPVPAAVPPPPDRLFGDLGGLRSKWESYGINLGLDWISEFAANVSGGLRQGSTSANQLGFTADIDWEKLAGLKGFSTHVIFVNRSGNNTSNMIGDHISPVQEIFGAGGDVVVHLVSAYAEESLFNDRLNIAGGWMNVENDFASSPLYCNYMNNDLCGDPKALPGGDIGHSAYPEAVWGGRIRVRPTADTYVTFGVYTVNQDLYGPRDRSGFEFSEPRISGVYVPVQLGYTPRIGPDQLPGHYVIGFGYDTSRFNSWALPASAGGQVSTHNGNTQFWILVDQMLMRNGPGDQDGLIALAGFVRNNPNNTSYAQQYYAGVLDYGFWRARPQDGVGFLFTYFAESGPMGNVQAEEQDLGLPISNGATGIQTHEMFLEANYNIHVCRGIDFRPELQYVIRPNGQSNIRNAFVVGFKLHVQL